MKMCRRFVLRSVLPVLGALCVLGMGSVSSLLAQGTRTEQGIRLIHPSAPTSGISLIPPTGITSYSLTFPASQSQLGTNSLLVNNGTGLLSWTTASAFIGSNAWSLLGNTNTDSTTAFIGTTDEAVGRPLIFKTDGLERMRINGQQGLIGIGTASPTAAMQLIPPTAATVGILVQGAVSQSGNLFEGRTSAGALRFSVGSTGNIFLGDVSSGATSSISFGNSNSGLGAMLVKNATPGSQIFDFYYGRHTNQNGSSLRFWRDQAKQVAVLTGNGDFGLGSTAPSQRLHVAGGNVLIDTSAASTAGQLQLMNPARTFQTNIQAGAQTANITYTLPTTAPTAGQLLSSDASGNMSWASASSTSWALTGNAGTTNGGTLGSAPTGNFIGTTGTAASARDLSLTTQNIIRMQIDTGGVISTQKDMVINTVTVGLGAGSVASNVAVGYRSLYSNNTTGVQNVAVGYRSLYMNSTGSNNVASGFQSMASNTSGSSNTASGYHSLYNNQTGNNNVAVGFNSLFSNTSGGSNVATGTSALQSNTIGANNTANGHRGLYYNTTGTNNLASGMEALLSNTTGNNNVAAGVQSLSSNTTGANNTASGFQGMLANTTGHSNVANGAQALNANTTGVANVAVGYQAGKNVNAGTALDSVSNSVFIGTDTRALANGDLNTIVIGASARGLGSNTAVLGSSSIVQTRLQGRVGIGADPTVSAGDAQLQVTAAAAANRGLVVKGAASQSANLIEAQNSSGTAQFSVGPTGATTVGAAGLTVDGTAGTSNVTLTSLSGTAGASVPSGYNRIVLANATGQLQQVATTALVGAPVSAGTTNNSTLRYDNSSTQWLENTSILMTNTGTITANNPTGTARTMLSFNAERASSQNGDGARIETRTGSAGVWAQAYLGMERVSNGVAFIFAPSFSGTPSSLNGAPIEAMRLANRSLGLGTQNPSERLHLAGGNLLIDTSTVGTAGQLQLMNPARTFRTNIQAGAQTANITYTLPTTAPTAGQLLSSDASGNMSWASASATSWQLTGNTLTDSTTQYIGSANAFPLIVRTSGTERMRVMATGAIGIGTTSPQGSLDVARGNTDSGYDQGEQAIIIRNNTTAANARMGLRFTSGTGTTGLAQIDLVNGATTTQGILSFGTRNAAGTIAERMRITASGEVGIGTLAPSQRLQVSGGNILIDTSAASTAGQLQLMNPARTFQTNIQAGAQTANITYTLPTTAPTAGQILSSDASGNMSWASATATSWGLTGNSYTNSSGALGGAPSGTYIGSTNTYSSSQDNGIRFVTNNVVRAIISRDGVLSTQQDITVNTVTVGRGLVGTGNGRNTALGVRVLEVNTTAGDATAVGYFALKNQTTGGSNTAIGSYALSGVQDGFSNTAVGTAALGSLVSGVENVAVGRDAGRLNIGSGNVFLGYSAGYNETGSSKLYIANDRDKNLVYGDFSTGRVAINAGGTTTTMPSAPGAALQVNSPAAATIGLIVKGATSQTANLFEAQNSSGTAVFSVDPSGVLTLSNVPSGSSSDEILLLNSSSKVAKTTVASLVANSGWALSGNTGTDSTSAFIGTTDEAVGRPLVFKTDGTERMRINGQQGLIGIGTSSPAAQLSITSSNTNVLSLGGNLTTADFQQSPAANQRMAFISGVNGTNGYGSLILGLNNSEAADQTLGAVAFGQTVSGKSGSSPGIKALITVVSSGSGGSVGGFGGEMLFSTRPDNEIRNLERMRITSAGNVGIGTEVPTQRLQVSGGNVLIDTSAASTAGQLQLMNPARTFQTNIQAGAQTANITYTLPTTAPTAGQILSSDASGNMSWANAAAASWTLTGNSITSSGGVLGSAPTGQYIGTNNATDLRIATNGLTRVIVASDGLVSLSGSLGVTGVGAFNGNVIVQGQILGSGGASIVGITDVIGATTINTSGTAATTIGNTTAATAVTINTGSTGGLTLGGIPSGVGTEDVLLLDGSNRVTKTTRANLFAGSGWALTGNTSTDSTTAFIGTTDEAVGRPLVFKTDGTERMRISGAGAISTTVDVTVNGLTVGRGSGGVSGNAVLGLNALSASSVTAARVVAVGALAAQALTTGNRTIAIGYGALQKATTNFDNTAVGSEALNDLVAGSGGAGSYNIAVGNYALGTNTTGQQNVAVGYGAGRYISAGTSNLTGRDNVYIGYDTRSSADANSNEIVIGHTAIGIGSNTAVLGNSLILATRLQGTVGVGMNPTGASNVTGLIVRAGSSQASNNLFTVQNSSGTALLNVNSNGSLTLDAYGASAGNTNELRFEELAANGTNYVGFKAADNIAANVIWTLPSADGTSGQVLSTNGSGTLSWASATATSWGLTGNGSTNPSTNYLGTSDAQPLVISTSATERVRVLASGNVGIGTNNPLNNLHVSGTAAIGAGYGIYYWQPSAGDKVLQLSSQTTPTTGTGSVITLGGRFSSDSNDVTTWASIAGLKENSTNSDGDGYLAFFTAKESQAGSFERMRVTSAGNVGIGTITPVYKLDVLGQTRITTTNTAGLILQRPADVWSANDYNDLLWQGTTGGGIDRPWGRIRVQVNQASGSGGSTFMSFYTNPDTQNDSEKMRLTAAGQLGIGTTTPGSILQVNGGAAIGYSASTAAPTNGLIVSGATTVGGTLTLSSVATGTGSDDVLLINASNQVTKSTRASLIGGSAWALTGNTGTTNGGTLGSAPTGNYLGTSGTLASARDLSLVTQNLIRMQIDTGGVVSTQKDMSVNSVTVGRGAGNVVSNVAVGNAALAANTTGSNNTSVGAQSMQNNTSGNNNTSNGYQALLSNTTGNNNTGTGFQALQSNTTGSNNTAFGTSALLSNTTGVNNTAVGLQSLQFNSTGNINTALGANSLRANTTGVANTASGASSLMSNTTGGTNTAFGTSSLTANTTGNSNTATGASALQSNSTGNLNTANGSTALQSNTSGSNNTAMGSAVLYANTTGVSNSGYGVNALTNLSSGSRNTAIGTNAGAFAATGNLATASRTVFLGDSTRINATGDTNEIVIGSGAVGIGSNSVVLGGSDITATRLQGNVGIGANPTLAAGDAQLQVTSSAAANRGLVVKGAASQTANLLELQNSAGTAQLSVGPSGATTIGGTLTLSSTASAAAADSVLMINSSNQVTKTTKAALLAGSGWALVGNSGTNPSSSYLGTSDSVDLVVRTNATERLRIAADGRIGLGTAPSLASTDAQVQIQSMGSTRPGLTVKSVAGATGLIVQGAASQTANLQEWKNSAGTNVATMNAGGNMTLGTFNAAGISKIDYYGNSSGMESLEFTNSANGSAVETGLTMRPGQGTHYISSIRTLTNSINGASNNVLQFMVTTDIGPSITPSKSYLREVLRLTTTNGALFTNQTAAAVAVTVKGAASQTANLLELQNSAGTAQLSVGPSGATTVGGTLTLSSTASAAAADSVLMINSSNQVTKTTRAALLAASGWALSGNAGTTNGGTLGSAPTGNFLGTTGTAASARDLSFVTNNVIQAQISTAGVLSTQNDVVVNGLTIGRGLAGKSSNVAVGRFALSAITTGGGNTAIGDSALQANTDGFMNTAVGSLALTWNTSGTRNTAMGYLALNANTTGAFNTAFGVNSLRANTTGTHNSAVGNQSLFSNTSGIQNIAHGNTALFANTTGNDNVAMGVTSLNANTTGSGNIGIGSNSLRVSTTGMSNSAVGTNAFSLLTSGSRNTTVGANAGRFVASGAVLTTASRTLLLGDSTRIFADADTNEIVIGSGAVGIGSNSAVIGGSDITATRLQGRVGIGANPTTAAGDAQLQITPAAAANIGLVVTGAASQTGNLLELRNSGGTAQLSVGPSGATTVGGTLTLSSTASAAAADSVLMINSSNQVTKTTQASLVGNVGWTISGNNLATVTATLGSAPSGPFLGTTTGNTQALQISMNNVVQAIMSSTGVLSLNKDMLVNGITVGRGKAGTGSASGNSIAIGIRALESITTGGDNVAVGYFALQKSTGSGTGGGRNVAVGSYALQYATTGYDNTAVGQGSMNANISGLFNVAIGSNSLGSLTSGNSNVAVGLNAGKFIADGSTANATASQSVYLGTNVYASESGNTNEVVIGYQATGLGSNSALLGNNSVITTRLQGTVGVGMTPTGASNVTGLIVRAGSSQASTNLFTVQNSSGTALLNVNSNGSLTLDAFGASAGNTNELRFEELAANGTNYVGFKAADNIAANVIWTLPSADGTSGQVLTTNGTGTLSWANASANSWALTGNTGTDSTSAYIGTTDEAVGRPLVFRTDGFERMRINGQQGLIGIGTSSPAAQLSITSSNANTLSLGGNLTTTDLQWSTNANMRVAIFSGVNGASGFSSLALVSNNTEAAGQTLGALTFGQTVSGKSGSNAGLKAQIQVASAGSGGSVGGFGGEMFFLTRSDNDTLLTERMRITTDGNVGIGISAATNSLHIDRGNATASYAQFTAGTTTAQTSSDGSIFGIDAGGNTIINQRENLDLIVSTNNTERMRIAAGGDVTIGGSVTATAFFESSDARLKDIVLRDGDVVYFRWKDKRDERLHIGYLAQEVKEKLPEQVKTDEQGMMSVNYIEVLVAKLRTLEKRVEELEKKLNGSGDK